MADRFTRKPLPSGGATHVPAGILPVVLGYAVFSALWIIFSDIAVERLFHDPAWIILISTLKGWLFVGVTSILLYGLLRRLIGHVEPGEAPPAGLRPLLLPMALLIAAIALMTGGAITHTIVQQKDQEEAALHTVVDLKAQQITDWLGERYADARFVQSSLPWFDLYRHWRETGDAASFTQLQTGLLRFRKIKAFQAVRLLDEQGKLLWHSEGAGPSLDPAIMPAIQQAAADGGIVRLGPYRDPGGLLHLDFIVPLSGLAGKPHPLVVLHIDPADYLFPTLQAWPVPSVSGETLLFRRDGSQVFCLKREAMVDMAAQGQMPLSEKNLLAAQVLRGESGLGRMIEGVDYRGVPVMGVAQAIPETDWFLVAKVDKEEFYAKSYHSVFWIALTGLLALFMAVAGILIFRQRQELAASLRLGEIQADKLQALALLDSIAEGSKDAIFAKDGQGRYLLFNREAARLTGKTVDQVLGRDDTAIFPPDEAGMLMDIGRQVMRENRIMTGEENLTTVDGKLTFLVTKGPLHDADGKVVGTFGISRDITARKKMEDYLRESEEFKHAILDSMSPHLVVVNPAGVIVEVNEPWRRFALENGPEPGRAARRTGIGSNYLEICAESTGESSAGALEARDGIQGVLAGGLASFSLEYPCHGPDKQRWFSMTVTPLGIGGKGVVIAHTDITARKRIEEDLRESLEEKVALLKEVHHRVKNNLQIVASLLNLQANRVPDRKVVDVLIDTRNRVRSIGLLHEVLYRSGNLAQINFPAYVRELCSQLLRSFGQAAAGVRLEESVAPVDLPLEQAVPCGLIISELVSNALKHAFPDGRPGRVMVEFDQDEGQRLLLRVRDNGVGLPPDFDPADTSTLGLQLVANLAGQLGGEMTVKRPSEGGAAFQVLFTKVSKKIPLGG